MKLQTKILLIFLSCLVYAVSRYHLFGDIPLQDFPMFVMNKVWASTALLLFCFSILSTVKSNKQITGYLCFVSSIIHIVLSVCLLEPHYFNKFYLHDQLSFQAQLCLSCGLYCFVCFIPSLFLKNNQSQINNNPSNIKNVCKATISLSSIFLLIHTSIAFYPGWLSFQNWPANLPPISLICFSVLVIVIVKKLLHKNS